MKKIGLIDVDGHNFPNLPLMKISAWHKAQGDHVEWYSPMFSGHMDKVYMSKVFSFTPDYEWCIDADEIHRGGTGYCIRLENGREVFCKDKDCNLPDKIEHIYPDYSLYPELTKDTAYGFMTRGCPRGCDFCIVGKKEGRRAYTVAPLSEFWNGQKKIVLLDPNPIAVPDWKDNLQQLIDSKAYVDFSQGLDIRLMTEEKAEFLGKIKIKRVHFAFDRYEDKEMILPKFELFKRITGWHESKLGVYVLTNFNTTLKQDLDRIYSLKRLGYNPYVMIYDKQHLPQNHILKYLQTYVNYRPVFNASDRFEDFDRLPDYHKDTVKKLGVI